MANWQDEDFTIAGPRAFTHSYYVVMRDFGGRIGFGADVAPEVTRNGVIDRIKSGEWDRVAFIHFVHDGVVEDVTAELLGEVSHRAAMEAIDEVLCPQSFRFDHAQDHR